MGGWGDFPGFTRAILRSCQIFSLYISYAKGPQWLKKPVLPRDAWLRTPNPLL